MAGENKPKGGTATAEPPAETPAPVQTEAALMLAEVRAAAAQMLEDARATADEMRAAAQAELADVAEQARTAAALAGEDPKERAKALVDHGRRQFEELTTGDGRVWLQHERDPEFEPVIFEAAGGKKSELRILRISRHEYTHMGRTETSPGVAYQFKDGQLEALSPDVADYLRQRPGFGSLFWEAGAKPGAVPDPKVMLDKVLEAAMDLDVDRLSELLEQEIENDKRPVVLVQIRAALKKIHGRTQG